MGGWARERAHAVKKARTLARKTTTTVAVLARPLAGRQSAVAIGFRVTICSRMSHVIIQTDLRRISVKSVVFVRIITFHLVML